MNALLRDSRDEAADLLRQHLNAGLEANAAFGTQATNGDIHALPEA